MRSHRYAHGVARTRGELWIHIGLFLAGLICIPAFFFELYRALSGNTLSWAYVFEWPLLFGYAIYMWRQMLRQERGEVPAKVSKKQRDNASDDEALARWNDYLAKVHGEDHADVDRDS